MGIYIFYLGIYIVLLNFLAQPAFSGLLYLLNIFPSLWGVCFCFAVVALFFGTLSYVLMQQDVPGSLCIFPVPIELAISPKIPVLFTGEDHEH